MSWCKNLIESMTHDPCLWGWAVLGLSPVHGSFDSIRGIWAYRWWALSEDFVPCFHVDSSCLRMVSGIKHRRTFVDRLLNNVVGVAGYFLGFRNQNCINDMDDSIRGFDVSFDYHCVINRQTLTTCLDGYFRTINSFCGVKLGSLFCFHFPGHNMICQDSGKLVFILWFK